MKAPKLSSILLFSAFLFILITCKDRESNNPFDTACPKEVFTPSDLKAEQQGAAVKLTWVQKNTNISGFVISRNENDGAMAEVAKVDKSVNLWSDNNIVGGKKYGYQLLAYAEGNLSNALKVIITPISVATVTTGTTVSGISPSTAVLGGNVTSDGGATVSERGICYGTSQNPTISDNKLARGNGTGEFSGTITGLSVNTAYYARAYAINSQGVAYGTPITFTTSNLFPAVVVTSVASNITSISAILGGIVTSDGNNTVTENGICYSLAQNPTTANTKIISGNGIGAFSTLVTELTAGTIYFVRAFATNSFGTVYGSQITLTTLPIASLPTVTTTPAASITSSSADLGGNVTSDGNASVTERGIVYSINQNPTTANNKIVVGSGSGVFNVIGSGLSSSTTYYVRAYAINSQGTAYGTQISFTTENVQPSVTVTTDAAKQITANSAFLGGQVSYDLQKPVTEVGVCFSTLQNPTTGNNKIPFQTVANAFSMLVKGLTPNTTYFVRVYAINNQGTFYGSQITFTTNQATLAIVTTKEASIITTSSAYLGGTIDSEGGATVIEQGICISTSQNPTTASGKTAMSSGFWNIVTGLSANTTYYVRAYAINSQGTAYGSQISFTTGIVQPSVTVTTDVATQITANSASLGGQVSYDLQAPVTEVGVCFSTSPNPTTGNNKIPFQTVPNSFSMIVKGLSPNTTYYVRVYAINSQGTFYGSEINFRTSQPTLAIVNTMEASIITTSSAYLGGTIESDGGGTITARGICISTSQNPDIGSNKTAMGSGTDVFWNIVIGLAANTTYYVRAYAINNWGIAYGNQISFKTDADSNTVTDIDGNVYHTVTIGTQVWMVENLKTTKYRNGDPIPNITDNTAWSLLKTGAYCNYNNEVNFANTYGHLYNWFAANDSRQIAPTGWHIPTDDEWTILITFLGGTNTVGGKLKETGTTHWLSPNTGATNESGFNALPGGGKGSSGSFLNIGSCGYWWTLTSSGYTDMMIIRRILNNSSIITSMYDYTNSGYSIRCVKDK